ncbi:MAG: proton-conducting transporter membrane subunit [Myxococcota bacterium]
MSVLHPVLLPALGALAILALDLLGRPGRGGLRQTALVGIRLGFVAIASLIGVALSLAWGSRAPTGSALDVDGFGLFGVGFIVVTGALVLALSLTHFGMARSRPAEPIALLLFSWAGAMAAVVTDHLVLLLVAIELTWLPMIALVAIDSRRLSSSESSLKAFFAHVFASLVFAHGLAFLFGATGRLDLTGLAGAASGSALAFEVGLTLVVVALLARAAVAPFHPWLPDVHEGAPSFVTTHVATVAQATIFLVLLRVLHAAPGPLLAEPESFGARLPALLTCLAILALLGGHAMSLVQVGLRRMIGWIAVGQIGFLTLALVESQGDGAQALLWGLVATGTAVTGVMATLSSLSHHERASEHVGDLAGMVETSPLRAALLGAFLLSLGGLPGTVGFVARFRILQALEHGGHRVAVIFGLVATVLALSAVGRPLLAMMRPADGNEAGSRALSNEQLVLLFCGLVTVGLGVSPVLGETNMAGQLATWIDRAVASLRP